MYHQVTQLFRNAPDLVEEFKQFLPDPSGASSSGSGLFSVLSSAREIDEGELRDKRKVGSGGTGNADRSGAHAKRKRRVIEKEVVPPKAAPVKVCSFTWSSLHVNSHTTRLKAHEAYS